MSETTKPDDLLPWEQLSSSRQFELGDEYGHYLDLLTTACSLETRIERFRHWLQERGIGYMG